MNERRIIACVDQSHYSLAVAQCATWVAKKVSAPLEILNVIDRHFDQGSSADRSGAIGFDAQEKLLDQFLSSESDQTRKAREQARLFTQSLRDYAVNEGLLQVDTRLRHGSLLECLTERLEETRLVVMGRRGHSSQVSSRDIGRTFEATVRGLGRPVLGVHEQFNIPQRFLFAFDASQVARRGVDTVLGSQLFKGLSGTLLMCGEPTKDGQKLLESAAQQLSAAGIPTQFQQVLGDPVTQLIRGLEQVNADLLVMGAYTHSPFRNLLFGSKTADMLRATKVPALLLR